MIQTAHIRRAWLGALPAMLVAGLLVTGATRAQEPLPSEVSAETAQSLVDLLEDDARRADFIANLKDLLAAQEEAAPESRAPSFSQRVTGLLSSRVDAISKGTLASVRAVVDLPVLLNQLRDLAAEPAVRNRWLEIATKLVVILGAATVALKLTQRLLRDTTTRMETRRAKEVGARLSTVVGRTIVDILPLLAFVAVAYIVLPLTEPRPFTRIIAISAINATVLIQAAMILTRAVFAPFVPHLRLFILRNETAAYIYVWVRRLAYVAGYGFVVAEGLKLLGFFPVGEVVARGVGLAVAIMIVIVVLQNHAAIRQKLRGDIPSSRPALSVLRRQFAEIWHILAILYVVGFYLVWVVRVPGGFMFLLNGTVLTVVTLVIARTLVFGLNHAITSGFSVGTRLRQRYPTLESRANRYLPIVRTLGVAIIYVVAAMAVLEAWKVRISTWLASDFGQGVVSGALTILIVLVVAAFLWELASSAVERYLGATDDAGRLVQRTARARTLLPLLRNAMMVVLVVVVALTILSEIGINIAPLLAAAGVVGIAIGFGSQKLVQDVINGLFILFENTITVGDVVEVAGHAGLVESISVRTITLRDLEGRVHVVPFSEVATILNMTQEFSFALLNVGVAYRENIAEVIEVLKQIGAELQADPVVGALILEPIEILGLDSFGDSAIVVKVRIKTMPIKQWTVKRAFNLRMKERFDALGIEIPFPHITMYFGQDKTGAAPPAFVSMAGQEPPAPRTAAVSKESEVPADAPAPTDD